MTGVELKQIIALLLFVLSVCLRHRAQMNKKVAIYHDTNFTPFHCVYGCPVHVETQRWL